jgi:hypothetical protein
MKYYIGEAVHVSPEASLAWAGVCLILPILVNPSVAKQANSDGFTYVTARMRFYVELEPLLLPKNQDATATVPKGLKKEFEDHIVDLYQHILDFQIKSVLRFYRSWRGNFGRDLIQYEDWEGMLSTIKKLEDGVRKDSEQINTFTSRQELEKQNESARKSLESMLELLTVAERLLQVQEEGLEVHKEGLVVQKEIARLTKDMQSVLLSNSSLVRHLADTSVVMLTKLPLTFRR